MKYYVTHVNGDIISITSTELTKEVIEKRKSQEGRKVSVIEITEEDFSNIQKGYDINIEKGIVKIYQGEKYQRYMDDKRRLEKYYILKEMKSLILEKLALELCGKDVTTIDSEINSLVTEYNK
jgi:hypothetical protein